MVHPATEPQLVVPARLHVVLTVPVQFPEPPVPPVPPAQVQPACVHALWARPVQPDGEGIHPACHWQNVYCWQFVMVVIPWQRPEGMHENSSDRQPA